MTTNHITSVYELPQAKTSHRTIAITSFVLSILGVFIVPAILAILGSSYVLANSEDTVKTERTRNVAYAAIVVSSVSLLFALVGLLTR